MADVVIDDVSELTEELQATLIGCGLYNQTIRRIDYRNNNLEAITWSQTELKIQESYSGLGWAGAAKKMMEGVTDYFWLGHYAYEVDGQLIIVPVIVAHPGGDAEYVKLPPMFVIQGGVMSGEKGIPPVHRGGHQYQLCFGTKKFDTSAEDAFPFFVFMPREYVININRFYDILDKFYIKPTTDELAALKWGKDLAMKASAVAGTASGTALITSTGAGTAIASHVVGAAAAEHSVGVGMGVAIAAASAHPLCFAAVVTVAALGLVAGVAGRIGCTTIACKLLIDGNCPVLRIAETPVESGVSERGPPGAKPKSLDIPLSDATLEQRDREVPQDTIYAIVDDLDDQRERIIAMENNLDKLERAMAIAEARHEESLKNLRIRNARNKKRREDRNNNNSEEGSVYYT
mmetsp:Transcript_8694/g.12572  ORF Transcript_8694/g.12572 Transcript_8694/m.12572 type:complete len:404 (+) Transcript_8694:128-1339(+)